MVYGAAQDENKLKFLSAFCSRNNAPTIIGGDFNIIRYSNERNRGVGIPKFSDIFNSLISFYELRELNMIGGLYT